MNIAKKVTFTVIAFGVALLFDVIVPLAFREIETSPEGISVFGKVGALGGFLLVMIVLLLPYHKPIFVTPGRLTLFLIWTASIAVVAYVAAMALVGRI